jgi:hypothetical protein
MNSPALILLLENLSKTTYKMWLPRSLMHASEAGAGGAVWGSSRRGRQQVEH